jgi:type IV secretory pathway VirB2 component (pilin)
MNCKTLLVQHLNQERRSFAKWRAVAVSIAFTVAAGTAHAGGLDAGTQAATTFQTWFYGFLGVVALIIIMYEGAMCWGGKKRWVPDFLIAVAGVAVVGGSLVLGAWAWAVFA